MELRNIVLPLTTLTFVKLKCVVGKRNLKHDGFVLLLCHQVLYLKHKHFCTVSSSSFSNGEGEVGGGVEIWRHVMQKCLRANT
jgi:hypothetical protein